MTRSRHLVFVTAVLFAWLAAGAPASAQSASDPFVRGIQRLQQGDYAQAVADFQQAVADHPDWDEAWYYLGVAQFQMVFHRLAGAGEITSEDYAAARTSLEKARELAPTRPGPRMYLGQIEEELGNYDAAMAWYQEELALKALTDKYPVQVAIGRVYYRTGRYADAAETMERVLAADQGYVEARYYLGLAQMARGDYKAAVETLKKAIKTLNDWLDRVYHLLRIQYLVLYPDDPNRASRVVEDWDTLRMELWSLREPAARPKKEPVEEVFQKYAKAQEFAIDLHLWPSLNRALGDAYLGLQDWAAARNAYRDAQEPRFGDGTTEDPVLWSRIGRAYFLNGKQTFERDGLLLRAIEEFRAAEGAQGPDPEKWDGYARALHEAGINKDAKLSDLEAPPRPDLVIAEIFDGLGELYMYEANTYATDESRGIISHTYDEAIEAFDKALLFAPKYIPAMLHKAQCLLSRGEAQELEADREADIEQARRLIESAVALSGDNPSADLLAEKARAYLAVANLYRPDREAALTTAQDAANQALARNRKHAVALNMLGLVLYYRGKYVAAADCFAQAVQADPRDFRSYLNLGNAFYGLRSWARARSEYLRALKLIPESTIANTGSQRPYVLYLIARTQYEQKLYQQAVQTASQALSLRTDFYEARRLIAAAYAGLGQWRAAEEALRGCLRMAPDDRERASVHVDLARVYEAQGMPYEAIAEYRLAAALHPESPEATNALQRLAPAQRARPGE